MLVAIGIIIIKKELPHAIGYDIINNGQYFSYEIIKKDYGTITNILHSFNFAHLGAILVTIASLLIIYAFNKIPALQKIKAIPGALVAVVSGIALNAFFITSFPSLAIPKEQLVMLPKASSLGEFFTQFTLPSFSGFTNPSAWVVGITIAIVASIETLLCLEAGDKMDPMKRFSSSNAELRAQGIGNMLSGLIGGLPMTSVIVRTTANVNAGAKTKLSAIFHGVFLLLSVLTIPSLLNKIPMASLAAILIMIGLKLASLKTFRHLWDAGKQQFIPFIVTVIAVVFTDLLKGVGIGLAFSIYFILKENMKLAYFFNKEHHHESNTTQVDLAQEVSFLNKATIKQTLSNLPNNSKLIINAAHTVYIDHDVLELIRDFVNFGSKDKNINVKLINFRPAYKMENAVYDYATTK
jgi:MFS superfamily sulfate permease-like transporter